MFGDLGDDVPSRDRGGDDLDGGAGADRLPCGRNSGADLVLDVRQGAGDRLDGGRSRTLAAAPDASGSAHLVPSRDGTVAWAGITDGQVTEAFRVR